jgi:hypothetical protein
MALINTSADGTMKNYTLLTTNEQIHQIYTNTKKNHEGLKGKIILEKVLKAANGKLICIS